MANAVLWKPKYSSRVTIARDKHAPVTLVLRPGRNTDATMARDVVAPPHIKASILRSGIIATLLASTHAMGLIKSGRLVVEEEPVWKKKVLLGVPPPVMPPAAAPKSDAELDQDLADGTEPLPWSKTDRVEDLRIALRSRGIEAEGMHKAQLLEALSSWDASSDGGDVDLEAERGSSEA